jgi:hypothetical protein
MEHALINIFGEVFLYQCMELEQAALVLVGSWPYIPDPQSLLRACITL